MKKKLGHWPLQPPFSHYSSRFPITICIIRGYLGEWRFQIPLNSLEQNFYLFSDSSHNQSETVVPVAETIPLT